MLRLSVTGVPDAWDSGGRLESSFIELLLSLVRWPRIAPVIEIPATQTALRQRYSCVRNDVCCQSCVCEKRRELKCIHPLRNEFVFRCCDCAGFCANLQKPEIIQLPLSASAQARALPTHPPSPRRERARRRDRGIAVIRPAASSDVAGEHTHFKQS